MDQVLIKKLQILKYNRWLVNTSIILALLTALTSSKLLLMMTWLVIVLVIITLIYYLYLSFKIRSFYKNNKI